MNLPNIDDLKNFGFIECGQWNIGSNDLIDYSLNNQSGKCERVLYAFADNNFIGYIGRSINKLSERLSQHRINVNNTKKSYMYETLFNCLKNGMDISILYYKPKDIVSEYRGIAVDLVCGLEFPLQWIFKTQWTTENYSPKTEAWNNALFEVERQLGLI